MIALKTFALALVLFGMTNAFTIRIHNNCGYTVWPGLNQHNFNNVQNFATLASQYTGARLTSGGVFTVEAPNDWVGGRVWGRTGCNADASSCTVGTCSGGLYCTDYNWTDKLTLAEWGYSNSRRYYDLSVVQGYNIPMQIYPASASTGCLTKTVYSPNPPAGQAWLPSEGNSSPSVANCVANANFGVTFCPSQ